MKDSKEISKIFRNSDNWYDVNVIEEKFLWLSGIVHRLEVGTQSCVVTNFLNDIMRKK